MPSKRDPKYTRTVGEKPFTGRRYVADGKVRIEWKIHGKRRSRTVGPNSPANRDQADEELERLLGEARGAKPEEPTAEPGDGPSEDRECTGVFPFDVDKLFGSMVSMVEGVAEGAFAFLEALGEELDGGPRRRKPESDAEDDEGESS